MGENIMGHPVEPLKGNINYYNWKFRMEMILGENLVLENVKQEIDISSLKDEKEKTSELKKENKAKSIITQCVEDSQLEDLRNKKTAYQMWKMLEDKYERKGLPEQLHLKRKLLSLKLKENESLEEFLTLFEETVRKLKAAGTTVSEEDLICNLLLSLPNSYQTLVTVIENSEGMTYEGVKVKLLGEYEKRKISTKNFNTTSQEMTAFHSTRGCFKCGKMGHIKRNCTFTQTENRNWRGGYQQGAGDFGFQKAAGRAGAVDRMGDSRYQRVGDSRDDSRYNQGESRWRGAYRGNQSRRGQSYNCWRGKVGGSNQPRNYYTENEVQDEYFEEIADVGNTDKSVCV